MPTALVLKEIHFNQACGEKDHFLHPNRGAFHSMEKAYEIFSEQKGSIRIFDGFFLKTKEFLPKVYESFWSEMPLDQNNMHICHESRASY